MAKGVKKSVKVSVRDWEKATKDNFPASVTEQWFGIPITIRYTISFGEMIEFVEGAVASCFDDDYGYLPEVKEFAIYNNILGYYTNMTLPEDLGKKYDLIYGSNIIEFVTAHISPQQLDDIYISVRQKIKHITETNVRVIEKEALRLLDAFDELQRLTGEMFSNVNVDDIRNLTHALGEYGTLDEEKIVEAIMNNQNKEKESTK